MPTATVSLFTEGEGSWRERLDKTSAPQRVNHSQRIVWLLGRPLQGLASLLAPGGFPFLHWAVLVSPVGTDSRNMTTLVYALQNPSWSRDIIAHTPMGLIQELRFDSSRKKTTYKGAPLTASEFLNEFNTSSLAYAGQTLQTDDEICITGDNSPFDHLSIILMEN
jgi:hypothetical protein